MKLEAERIVKNYLSRMAEIRSTGGATDETSYYSPFENLMNEVGHLLDPHVICNGQLKNQGAGHPDFGFYSKKQCSKGAPKKGQGENPERGVVEAKGLDDDSLKTSIKPQTNKYLDHYGLVLVTNYREFRLIGKDDFGSPLQREFYSLAESETAFWAAAGTPQKSAKEKGHQLIEFLKRVLMTAAPLYRPEDVAWFLASYARDALAILEAKDTISLKPLRDALEIALGIKFVGEKAEHFFRSTLVQTLFYGVFSAWVVEAKRGHRNFDWRIASHVLTVPMVRALFEEIAKPTHLNLLGLNDILDRTGETLNRISEHEFFASFGTDRAVQHFYEPFLEAFDPELRKEMGVWYTPPDIVKYMVERVDMVLRTELGIADGLADNSVYVLDPCCGTGTYIVEVLKKIEQTLRNKGTDALLGDDIKEAAQKRVFGFEIMSAPFVIAHWQVGNLLESLGAPLDPSKHERPAIYLTNALTGWEPPKGPKAMLPLFPELAEERDQAEHIKRDIPILVILGNPPYNAFAGTSPAEEEGLVEPYKEGLVKKWGIKKFNLDDLYIRFFRIAERRIAKSGRGIVSYISNYSYTSEPSFVVMRENLLQNFDKFWIENMHGNRKISERAPDGKTSETIFAVRGFSSGIRQGVVVGLAVKTGLQQEQTVVRYRDDLTDAKAHDRRQRLLESLDFEPFDNQYEIADPQEFNRYSFRPIKVGADYLKWPNLVEISAVEPINGLMEKRGGALIDVDKTTLIKRMQGYYDKGVDWEGFVLLGNPLSKDASRFDAKKTRERVLRIDSFDLSRVVRFCVRPFDVRYCYYTAVRPVWNETRPQLWEQFSAGNRFLVSRPAGVANPEGVPFHYTASLGDNDALRGHAYYFPFTIHAKSDGLFPASVEPNLSRAFRDYLSSIGMSDSKTYTEAVWQHILAVGFSRKYLSDNAVGISIDWPRIPLPNEKAVLKASSAMGKKLAGLLDADSNFDGVTTGKIAGHLRILGAVSATNLAFQAGWGRMDSQRKVYPGKGKWESREWTNSEKETLGKGFADLGITEPRGLELLGRPIDVYLNETTHWAAVPEAVWNYYIGGYQVIKKWLSYREETVLARIFHQCG